MALVLLQVLTCVRQVRINLIVAARFDLSVVCSLVTEILAILTTPPL